MGQPVEDRDFCRLSSPRDQVWFHSLVRALVDRDALEKGAQIVLSSDQDSARDRGIDFLTLLEGVPEGAGPPHFVGSGHTVFQVKFRTDRSGAGFARPSDLGVEGSASKVRTETPFDRYVLITNLRVEGREDEIRDCILDAWPERDPPPQVEIAGAERLATMVNAREVVREAWFGGGSLLAPARVERGERNRLGRLRWPRLAGREREMERVRAWLRVGSGGALVVGGESGSGKTRLLLEALAPADLAPRTIWCEDPASLDDRVLLLLEGAPSAPTFLVIDDVDVDSLGRIRRKIERHPGLRGVILCHAGEEVVDVFLRRIEGSAPDEIVSDLEPNLDQATRSWIVQAGEGSPGLLVALAGAVREHGLTDLRAPRAIDMLETAVDRLPIDARQALGVYSLLAAWSTRGEGGAAVLECVCRDLGVDPGVVRSGIGALLRRGLLADTGHRREVRPAALAARLGARALREHSGLASALLGHSQPVRIEFLRRFAGLKEWDEDPGEDTERRIAEWTREAIEEGREEAAEVAHLFPERAIDAVLARGGLRRRDVDLLLDVGLARRATFERSIEALLDAGVPSEQEWRLWSHLDPRLPSPLSPSHRAEVLTRLWEQLPQARERILEGIRMVMHGAPYTPPRHRATILESQSARIWGEYWDYWDSVLGTIGQSIEPEEREKRLSGIFAQILSPRALEIAECLVPERVPIRDLGALLSTLSRAEADERAKDDLRARYGRLRERLEGGSLLQKLRVEVGVRVPVDFRARQRRDYRELARELLDAPGASRRKVLRWLASEEAKHRDAFSVDLGREDSQWEALSELAALPEGDRADEAIAAWLRGRWLSGDPRIAEAVAEVRGENRHLPAILHFHAWREPSSSAVAFLLEVIEHRLLPAPRVAAALEVGPLGAGMERAEFSTIVQALRARDPTAAALAVATRLERTEEEPEWRRTGFGILSELSASEPEALKLLVALARGSASPDDLAEAWIGLLKREPDPHHRFDHTLAALLPEFLRERHGFEGLAAFFRGLAESESERARDSAGDLVSGLADAERAALLLEVARSGGRRGVKFAVRGAMRGLPDPWSFAADLVESCPLDERLRDHLRGNIVEGGVNERKLDALDEAVAGRDPGEGRRFLEKQIRPALVSFLAGYAPGGRYCWDLPRFDLVTFVRDPHSPEGKFALARMLNEGAPVSEVKRIAGEAAVTEVFEDLELKPRIRRMWEPIVERWRSRRDAG